MILPHEILEWRHIIDILLVGGLIYLLLVFFRGTLAAQALKGIGVVAAVVIVANFFRLETLTWIIERLAPVVLVGVIVLFQPELRRGLARIGERSFGAFFALEGVRIIEEISQAAVNLAGKRHGALIAFERETGLEAFIETGILLNAEVTQELALSIFYPKSALHDGAVIIRGNTLVAAGCILPLAHDESLKAKYGTRHLAAMGLSRETDAIAVVVSEETGAISIAAAGQLVKGVDERTLKEMLTLYLSGTKVRGRA